MPGLWHRASHASMVDMVPVVREVTPPSGPSGRAPHEAMGQGCQGDVHVALQSCFNNTSYFFSSRTETLLQNSGCSQCRTLRQEVRPRLCPAAALKRRDLLASGESMHFFHYEKDTRDQKGASARPRLLATSPGWAPGQPNCHCVRYCENGNHFLSSKPEVSIPSLQDVIRKEGD